MPDVISMTWSEWQESRAVKRANLARLGLDMPSRRETDHGTAGRRLRKAFAGLRVPKFAKEPSGRAVSMSAVLALFGFVSALSAQTAEIKLPAPTKTGGMPVVQAIAERKTSRAFSERELPLATLSTLLWVADGISRPDGRRTIPTGHNVQDLDVYVILKTGAYRYDEKAHALKLIAAGDFHRIAAKQSFAQTAPVNLYFVQDVARAKKTDAMSQLRFGGIHTGSALQNVYLYCTSEGLVTVAREQNDYAELSKVFKLSPSQRIILAQSVGYPSESK